jgi:hypothetical protein
MTTELYWLTLTVLTTALFWVPYILDRLAVRGVWPALSDTKPGRIRSGPARDQGPRECRREPRHSCAGGADCASARHLDPGDEDGGRDLLLRAPGAFLRLNGRHSRGPHARLRGRLGRANRHSRQHSSLDLKRCAISVRWRQHARAWTSVRFSERFWGDAKCQTNSSTLISRNGP